MLLLLSFIGKHDLLRLENSLSHLVRIFCFLLHQIFRFLLQSPDIWLTDIVFFICKVLLENCPNLKRSNSHEYPFYPWTVLLARRCFCVCVRMHMCMCVHVFCICAFCGYHPLGSVRPSGVSQSSYCAVFLCTVVHAWKATIILLLDPGKNVWSSQVWICSHSDH